MKRLSCLILAVVVLALGSTNPLAAQEPAFPGGWPMAGTNLWMKIGGYVKVDALYDVDGTRDPTQFLMRDIPVPGEPDYEDGGYFNFFARETRFNIEVRRVEEGARTLRLFLEGDFFSAGNQFRLRHAYVVAGDFVVGQNWTTISILESLPFMIDFGAGDALFGGRTAVVRYQKTVNDKWKYSLGAEMLPSMGIENPEALPGKPSVQLPLLAARVDYKWSTGTIIAGTSLAQLRWDGGRDGPSATGMQFDAVVGGRQNLGANTTLTFNVSGGVGSGENILAFAGTDANAVLTPEGTLETMPSFAVVGGLMHNWNSELASTVSYAYGWLEAPESRDPLALKRGGIGHVNLVYRPAKQFATGVEYMWGGNRTTSGALGTARRFQGMAAFYF